jgi:hypothetical protein
MCPPILLDNETASLLMSVLALMTLSGYLTPVNTGENAASDNTTINE